MSDWLDPRDLDPIEPTHIAPNAAVVPLGATVWDDLPDGQQAVTANGWVWRRRSGLWHCDPWWQGCTADEIVAAAQDPDEWASDLGWPRAHVEETYGPLTPVASLRAASRGETACSHVRLDGAPPERRDWCATHGRNFYDCPPASRGEAGR